MDGCWEAFDVAVAEWRLCLLPSEGLPGAALVAVSAGCEGASLARLAGMDGSGWSEIQTILVRVLVERGVSLVTLDEAIDTVISSVLQGIAGGTIPPEVGLARLMNGVVRAHVDVETPATDYRYVGESRGLEVLVGAYWAYDEVRARPDELSIDGRFEDEASLSLIAKSSQPPRHGSPTRAPRVEPPSLGVACRGVAPGIQTTREVG